MKLLACKNGSSTPQPIPSCRRPSFSRHSDHKDSSLDRQSSALPHGHQLGLGSVLQFLSSAVFNSSQSLAPCFHVLCVFTKFVSFPAHQTPRLQYLLRNTTPPPTLTCSVRTYLTVLSSAVLTPPRASTPASVFGASSLTAAVCEYARL